MERINHKKGCSGIKTLVFGLVVVATGVVLMLNNMGKIDPEYAKILISWPMLIIAFGFINLFGKEFPFGIVLITAGGLFMGTKFFGLPLNFEDVIWPSVIILFGLMIILGGRMILKGGFTKSKVNNNDVIEDVSIFSGSEHNVTSPDFKGGKFVCVFGGSKVNLLQTNISTPGTTVELVAIFGGLTLIVPSDWNVKTEVASIFGGFGDKRIITATSPDKLLIVKGVCIFGGGEIKSIPD